jgi:DNA polymerase-3 subunit alpha (Gram-positive type)
LYKSHHHKFQIIDGKLLPPFDTLNGMGATAAESIVEAREQGEFLTIEDFLSRTKVSRTMADTMKELGIMGDLPETDQMSLF